MPPVQLTAPNAAFTGPGPGGVVFTDGVGYTDNEAVLNYCRAAGYGVGDDVPHIDPAADDDPATPDPAGDAETPNTDGDQPPAPEPTPDAKVGDTNTLPHANASHAVWVAYAIAHGMDASTAQQTSRNTLRDQYTS